ncbi:unnamed protein product, partial [Mesorhabditis spiculigera]
MAHLAVFLLAFANLYNPIFGCAGRYQGCFQGESAFGDASGVQLLPCQGVNNWCAISYSTATQRTKYMCGSELALNLGLTPSHCGNSILGINNGGCQMSQIPGVGDCYLCCCSGYQCNHPGLFNRDASRQLGYEMPYDPYNSAFKNLNIFIVFGSVICTILL